MPFGLEYLVPLDEPEMGLRLPVPKTHPEPTGNPGKPFGIEIVQPRPVGERVSIPDGAVPPPKNR
jgi:hypothetical protein